MRNSGMVVVASVLVLGCGNDGGGGSEVVSGGGNLLGALPDRSAFAIAPPRGTPMALARAFAAETAGGNGTIDHLEFVIAQTESNLGYIFDTIENLPRQIDEPEFADDTTERWRYPINDDALQEVLTITVTGPDEFEYIAVMGPEGFEPSGDSPVLMRGTAAGPVGEDQRSHQFFFDWGVFYAAHPDLDTEQVTGSDDMASELGADGTRRVTISGEMRWAEADDANVVFRTLEYVDFNDERGHALRELHDERDRLFFEGALLPVVSGETYYRWQERASGRVDEQLRRIDDPIAAISVTTRCWDDRQAVVFEGLYHEPVEGDPLVAVTGVDTDCAFGGLDAHPDPAQLGRVPTSWDSLLPGQNGGSTQPLPVRSRSIEM